MPSCQAETQNKELVGKMIWAEVSISSLTTMASSVTNYFPRVKTQGGRTVYPFLSNGSKVTFSFNHGDFRAQSPATVDV